VTDFWRRWHMTLSRWFRDYVYIPLGGSRASRPRVYANLVATFLLTGFWHGAQWTFILWGAYHGTLLLLERLLGQRPVGDAPVARVVVRRAVTLLLVMVGWVIFRADSFAGTLRYVGRMFSPNGWSIGPGVDVTMTHEVMLIGALALVIFLLPRRFVLGRYLASQGTAPALTLARLAAAGALFPLALGFVVAGTFHPFLYFRF
jgi:alginate O-acetyltransferase complex protein AlgI